MAVSGKRATTSIGSDEDLHVYCQPCDRDGPRIAAFGYCKDCREHLCETCFTVHKRHTLSRHHTLLDKDNMPQTLAPTSVHPSQPDVLTTPCPRHKKEMIKFYCHSHKALFCSVCVTLEHTSCKVSYIPDISDQFINSKEYHDILKVMDSISEQCHTKSDNLKKMISKSNASLTEVLADVKKFRKEINQRLDELERQAEDAAKAIKQENNKNLDTVEKTCDDVTKSLKTSSDFIKYLNSSKQSDRLFMELKFAEQMIKDYEKCVHQLSAYDIKDYDFKPNESLSNLLAKEKSLGALSGITMKQAKQPETFKTASRQKTFADEICVKTSGDISKCWITGMIVLTPGTLIITDNYNKAVKMVDTSTKSVTGQLKVNTKPLDVASVTKNELAVTLPEEKTIQFISVSSDKLAKKHIVKLDGNCRSISCNQNKMVVSFREPAKIQIMEINGTVLRTVRDENVFRNPFFLTTSCRDIYVSDFTIKTITRLNWQGEVTAKYESIGEPHGLAMSDDGTVFVCNRSKHVIEEMSGDCSKAVVVLNDMKSPKAVCWCAETKILYMSSSSSSEKYDNFLQTVMLNFVQSSEICK